LQGYLAGKATALWLQLYLFEHPFDLLDHQICFPVRKSKGRNEHEIDWVSMTRSYTHKFWLRLELQVG
jgi:hypothetical protein